MDELIKRGLRPWLCLCYGNVLYDKLAGKYQGAVGCPPIRSKKAFEAWLAYVTAAVGHYAGRIEYYEIWNEPEGGWTWRPEPDAAEYADFAIKTAKVIKKADRNAKVITGSHYQESLRFFSEEFSRGTLAVSDAVSFHFYGYDERKCLQRAKAIKELIKRFGGCAEVIQGESGSQSKTGVSGALAGIRADQEIQTKQILRRTVADLLSGVKFTSLFSCVDMAENLDAKEGEPIVTCGYFGLLEADFDKKTGKVIGEYREKPSYYAFRNLCTLFSEIVVPDEIPAVFAPIRSKRLDSFDCPTKELVFGGLKKKSGANAFAYWASTDLLTAKDFESTVSFELAGLRGDVRLVDPLDGAVYSPGEDVMTVGGGVYSFKNLPVKDYPLILTFGNFIK